MAYYLFLPEVRNISGFYSDSTPSFFPIEFLNRWDSLYQHSLYLNSLAFEPLVSDWEIVTVRGVTVDSTSLLKSLFNVIGQTQVIEVDVNVNFENDEVFRLYTFNLIEIRGGWYLFSIE